MADTLEKLVTDLRKQYQAKADKAEALRRERDELAAAPASREDMIAAADFYVEDMQKRYRAELQKALKRAAVVARRNPDGEVFLASEDPFSRNIRPTGPGALEREAITAPALALILGPEPIREALYDAIDAIPDLERGISAKDRQPKLAKLDSAIDMAEAELKELRANAARNGVFLES